MERPTIGDEGAAGRVDVVAAALRAAGCALERLADLVDMSQIADSSAGPLSQAGLTALHEENRQLREALESRSSIERAKGVLMARHNCSESEAFAILASTARRRQRKVRIVADELLANLALPGDTAAS